MVPNLRRLAGLRRSPLFQSVALVSLGMIVQGAARFVYTTWVGNANLARLGVISALLSLSLYVTLLWPAAIGVAATRFLSSDRPERSVLRLLNRSLGWFSLIAGVVSLPIAFALSRDVIDTLLAAALVVSYGYYTFTRGSLIGQGRPVRLVLLDALAAAVSLVTLATIVFSDQSKLLLLPLTLGYLIFAALAWRRGSVEPVPSALRAEVVQFCRNSVVGLVAGAGLLPIAMVVAHAFDSERSSIFAAAVTLATPPYTLAQSLTQVLIPHFATRFAKGDGGVGAEIRRLFGIVLLGSTAVFSGLIVGSGLILGVVFPRVGPEGVVLLRGLLLVVLVQSIIAVPNAVLLASGRERQQALASLIGTVVGTAVMVASAARLGVYGALIGFGAGAAVTAAPIVAWSFRDPTRVPAGAANGSNAGRVHLE